MYVLLSLHRRGHRHLRHVKHLSTTAHSQLHVPLNHPTFLVWASNTSLGKTLVSTGLAASSLLNPIPKPRKFLYLKPVQTSFPSDSDSSFVFHRLSRLSLLRRHLHPHFSLFSSNHILKASFPAANSALGQEISETPHSGMRDLGYYEETKAEGDVGGGAASQLMCKTLYAWREAVSPHLAAERESGVVEDIVME
nr:bifunctional dethiobiotin synthetase/7,8-diamino-pelargonic acid aminotransferase, mitochondrial-like [Quercus suber]POE60642.1 isoform 4 of bifunctional dethiobiotin synthetase/7,8-diamino-pelargonic acid aminotransferase, mitochondrial [Quercus suber]